MKIWAYVALVTVVAGMLTWLYNAIYTAGATSERLVCTVQAKDRADAAASELSTAIKRERRAVEATDSIARAFHNTTVTQVEKNAELQKKLSEQSTISECVENDSGGYDAFLSIDVIRVLNKCSNETSLPATEKEQGFIVKDKVTAADLAGYTCFAISEYNRCAIEVNSALDEINVEMKNHD